jgi:hypothetical protein
MDEEEFDLSGYMNQHDRDHQYDDSEVLGLTDDDEYAYRGDDGQ